MERLNHADLATNLSLRRSPRRLATDGFTLNRRYPPRVLILSIEDLFTASLFLVQDLKDAYDYNRYKVGSLFARIIDETVLMRAQDVLWRYKNKYSFPLIRVPWERNREEVAVELAKVIGKYYLAVHTRLLYGEYKEGEKELHTELDVLLLYELLRHK